VNSKTLAEAGKNIKPYRPAPPVKDVARDLDACVLKVNFNENLFLTRKLVQEVLLEAVYETDPRIYPEDEGQKLCLKIAEMNKIEPGQVMITAGGDQLIELIFNLLGPGDRVTAVTPTFSMYSRAAQQRGVELVNAALEPDFSLNPEKTLELAKGSELLVLCNPNNPTGNQFKKDSVIKLIEGFDGLVLVDEAYQEYSEYTLAELVNKYDNLVILRTFSKAYGFAGLRLGYCIACEELVSTLREKYMMPYPVSNLILRAGVKMLEQTPTVFDAVEEAKQEREWITSEINKVSGVTAYPSDANFVLFKTEKPINEVYGALLSQGVIVSRQPVFEEDCLRVTVAPRRLGERFIEALREATR
jgi:histidinol-phosphate aminotransferase